MISEFANDICDPKNYSIRNRISTDNFRDYLQILIDECNIEGLPTIQSNYAVSCKYCLFKSLMFVCSDITQKLLAYWKKFIHYLFKKLNLIGMYISKVLDRVPLRRVQFGNSQSQYRNVLQSCRTVRDKLKMLVSLPTVKCPKTKL